MPHYVLQFTNDAAVRMLRTYLGNGPRFSDDNLLASIDGTLTSKIRYSPYSTALGILQNGPLPPPVAFPELGTSHPWYPLPDTAHVVTAKTLKQQVALPPWAGVALPPVAQATWPYFAHFNIRSARFLRGDELAGAGHGNLGGPMEPSHVTIPDFSPYTSFPTTYLLIEDGEIALFDKSDSVAPWLDTNTKYVAHIPFTKETPLAFQVRATPAWYVPASVETPYGFVSYYARAGDNSGKDGGVVIATIDLAFQPLISIAGGDWYVNEAILEGFSTDWGKDSASQAFMKWLLDYYDATASYYDGRKQNDLQGFRYSLPLRTLPFLSQAFFANPLLTMPTAPFPVGLAVNPGNTERAQFRAIFVGFDLGDTRIDRGDWDAFFFDNSKWLMEQPTGFWYPRGPRTANNYLQVRVQGVAIAKVLDILVDLAQQLGYLFLTPVDLEKGATTPIGKAAAAAGIAANSDNTGFVWNEFEFVLVRPGVDATTLMATSNAGRRPSVNWSSDGLELSVSAWLHRIGAGPLMYAGDLSITFPYAKGDTPPWSWSLLFSPPKVSWRTDFWFGVFAFFTGVYLGLVESFDPDQAPGTDELARAFISIFGPVTLPFIGYLVAALAGDAIKNGLTLTNLPNEPQDLTAFRQCVAGDSAIGAFFMTDVERTDDELVLTGSHYYRDYPNPLDELRADAVLDVTTTGFFTKLDGTAICEVVLRNTGEEPLTIVDVALLPGELSDVVTRRFVAGNGSPLNPAFVMVPRGETVKVLLILNVASLVKARPHVTVRVLTTSRALVVTPENQPNWNVSSQQVML